MKEEEEESEMEQGNNSFFKLTSKAKREKFLLNSSKKPQPKISDVFSKSKPSSSESGSGESGWSPSSVQYKTDDARAKEGHLAILKMIILDMTPFNVVESPGFVNLVHVFNKNYEMKSRKFYSNLLVKVYENALAKSFGMPPHMIWLAVSL